ncbi:NUDIX domain-containing protein [bacterium]|nr:NUDIX domain-containing protein [bacterium]
MKLLKEIVQTEGMKKEGKILYREAVKGIIRRENMLLMIYSPQNGDYKFPGGGVNGAETHEATLAREIQEECGARLSMLDTPFGKIIEYKTAREPAYDMFQMTSYYYLCHIEPEVSEQRLDPYEHALGFQPVWVDIDDAIRINRAIIYDHDHDTPPWTERETFVLEQVNA